jgi:hypothetical protein
MSRALFAGAVLGNRGFRNTETLIANSNSLLLAATEVRRLPVLGELLQLGFLTGAAL